MYPTRRRKEHGGGGEQFSRRVELPFLTAAAAKFVASEDPSLPPSTRPSLHPNLPFVRLSILSSLTSPETSRNTELHGGLIRRAGSWQLQLVLAWKQALIRRHQAA